MPGPCQRLGLGLCVLLLHICTVSSEGKVYAGARTPIEQLPLSPGPLGMANVPNRSSHVREYPRCQNSHNFGSTGEANTKEYMIQRLIAAPTYRVPFNSATYFCGIFPEHVYQEIIENFPPDKAFENYASKVKNCGGGGCRYTLSAFNIVKQKNHPTWPNFRGAKELYQKLMSIVFSKEFEAALWKKLQITKKAKRREFRILSDKHGYANGRIHTDLQARKIATMMFYLPVTDKTAFDYGTCIHTTEQWKKRNYLRKANGQLGAKRGDTGYDGEGDCYYKFRFLPNTGYSFKAGPASWHSAPNTFIEHYDEYDRNTILLNWY